MEIAAVVGLGNPGGEYAGSRHNVGFRVVDALAARWRLAHWERRFASLVARRSGHRPVWLAKPQTFMNLSGEAVAALCRGADIQPHQCLVVVDDVDLPLGQLRLRGRGGSGTHNGLRSVVEAVGEDFPRLRLGVRGADTWADLAAYVLGPFHPEEAPVAEEMISRAGACVEAVLFEGLPRAANRFNAPRAPSDDTAEET
jgi:PTH1 family peptidyl-tRNA hydrolase